MFWIINELKKYYGNKCVVYDGKMSLKQKDKAETYLEYKQSLKDIEISLIVHEVREIKDKSDLLRKEIDVLYDEDGHYVIINDDKIYLTDSVQQRTYVDEYGLS